MSITICTVSGKGGTGKSTVSCGLGIAAELSGKSVLLIDLDCGLRCLDLIFGVEESVVFDLSDALETNDISKATYKSLYYENIRVIPASSDVKDIDFSRLKLLVDKVKDKYDIIVLDFPAGAHFNNYNVFSDAVFLIVSGADPISVRDAAVISGGIKSSTPPRLIINRFDYDMIKCGMYKNIDDIIDTALTQLIGIVPADSELLLISTTHKLKPKGRAIKAFDRIIKRIQGEDIRLPHLKKI